jgi:hypothetical protein
MIKIELQNFDKFQKAMAEAPKRMRAGIVTIMPLIARSMMSYISGEAPKKTGNLAFSGHEALFSNGGLTLTIQNSKSQAPYAPFVNFGTRPHTILPRIKKALFWEGASHPVKMVRHPGTKANPYFDRAIDNATPEIEKTFNNVIDRVINEI